ncbi:helix-turn-helix transcriptional regulator [Clostridium sp. ZBS18]|uniref:helix-turn-helix domain-containing protein n=1 Tax=Clostridium sp. ZBS18 TaxID=2949967 RepID=UPI002079336A|nr:helix-turn-helix transcriptional regulator [Clostridium sp. ZBS18]
MLKLNIEKIRTAKRLSQDNVGLNSGYSQNYISLLEKGKLRKKSPTLRVIERLAIALNCCIYELIDGCPCEKCQQKRKENSGE